MEKLNIAKLLKDCPTGMELNCTMYEDVYFDCIDQTYGFIKCYILQDNNSKSSISFTEYGCYTGIEKSKCVIFPKGKTTWEGFQRPFKDGDILSYQCEGLKNRSIYIYMYHNSMNTSYYVALSGNSSEFLTNCTKGYALNGYNDTARFATEEEKQKLFKAIKENGYKWNAETKTLEKLIEQKFKVGDSVRLKSKPNYIYTIHSLSWDDKKKLAYRLLPFNDKYLIIISLDEQDNYELVPNKFDISTLVPFDRVLTRITTGDIWGNNFFGYYKDGLCHCSGNSAYRYCIPYEGNQHLIGTTNDCDDFYKTWK